MRGPNARLTWRADAPVARARLADGALRYRFGERDGQYRIAGRTIVANIDSDQVHFSVAGHGRATLRGEGTCWVHGQGPFRWSDAESDIALSAAAPTGSPG